MKSGAFILATVTTVTMGVVGWVHWTQQDERKVITAVSSSELILKYRE
jgi:hypothetical protein